MLRKRVPTDQEYRSYLDGTPWFGFIEAVKSRLDVPRVWSLKREITRWTKRQPKPWKRIHVLLWVGWLAIKRIMTIYRIAEDR